METITLVFVIQFPQWTRVDVHTLVARRLVKRYFLVLQACKVAEGVVFAEGELYLRLHVCQAVEVTRLGSVSLREAVVEGYWTSMLADSSNLELAFVVMEAVFACADTI